MESISGKGKKKGKFCASRRIWDYTIRMDLREIGWEGVDWTHMDQDKDQ
jgi:hypothetical protein